MRIKANEICTYGILGALTFSLKFAMSALPNIELVSLLLTAYTIVFGWNAIYPLSVYVFLEILVYGLSFWSMGYLYIWLVLIVAVRIIFYITNSTNVYLWALVNGIYGLSFGILYVPLYLITGGTMFAITWWINGIPYDIVHGVANFILCLMVFRPIINTLFQLKKNYFGSTEQNYFI